MGASRIAIQTELQRLDEATKGRGEKLDLLTVRYRDFLNQQESAKSRSEGIQGQINRDKAHIAERTEHITQIDEQIRQLEGELEGFLASLGKNRKTIEDHINQINKLEKSNARLEEETDTLSLEVKELSDAIVIQLEEQLRSSGYTTKARNEARSILLSELEHIKQSILKEQEFLAKLKAADLSVETLFKRQHEFFSTLGDSLASLSGHFTAYEGTQASFLDELIAPEGTIAKKQSLDLAIAQKRKEIIRNRERVSHLREENLHLQSQMDLFQDAITEHQSALSQLRSNKESAQAWIANLRSTITEREYEYKDALAAATNARERIHETQEDIRATEEEVKEIKTRIVDLNQELEELATRIEEQNLLIQNRETEKEDAFNEIQNLRSEREKAELHAQNLEEQIAGLYTNFFDTYGKSLKEFEHRLEEEELDDSPALRARFGRSEEASVEWGTSTRWRSRSSVRSRNSMTSSQGNWMIWRKQKRIWTASSPRSPRGQKSSSWLHTKRFQPLSKRCSAGFSGRPPSFPLVDRIMFLKAESTFSLSRRARSLPTSRC